MPNTGHLEDCDSLQNGWHQMSGEAKSKLWCHLLHNHFLQNATFALGFVYKYDLEVRSTNLLPFPTCLCVFLSAGLCTYLWVVCLQVDKRCFSCPQFLIISSTSQPAEIPLACWGQYLGPSKRNIKLMGENEKKITGLCVCGIIE